MGQRGMTAVIMLWIITLSMIFVVNALQQGRDQILWVKRPVAETRLDWAMHAAVMQAFVYAVAAGPDPSADCPHPWLNARLVSPMPDEVAVSFVTRGREEDGVAWRLEPDTAVLAVNTITADQSDFLKELMRGLGLSTARAASVAELLVDARDADTQWVRDPRKREEDVYGRSLPDGPLSRRDLRFVEDMFQGRSADRFKDLVCVYPLEAPFVVDMKSADPLVSAAWITVRARSLKWPPWQADAVHRLLMRHRRRIWTNRGCLPHRPPGAAGSRLSALFERLGYGGSVRPRAVRFIVQAVDRRTGLARRGRGVVSLKDWTLVSWRVRETSVAERRGTGNEGGP